MAHELAGALQQAARIRQLCAVKEPHVYVRSEYIDVAEGRVSQTCNRAAVMQKLPDFVPAFSHHLKPLMRDGSELLNVCLKENAWHRFLRMDKDRHRYFFHRIMNAP